MATFKKLPSGNWRAQLNRAGLPRIGKTFPTKPDAQKWARSMEGDDEAIEAAGLAAARNHTLADTIDAALDDGCKVDRSRAAWWKTNHGHLTLAELTRTKIRSALSELADREAHGYNTGTKQVVKLDRGRISKVTVNRYHAAISSVLQWAVDKTWVTRNQARDISYNGEDNKRIRWLTESERKALFEAVDGSKWPDLGLLVRLAISTGARLGDLIELRWDQLDFDRSLAFVSKTKNEDPRAMPLLPSVQAKLEAKKAALEARGGPVAGLIFPSTKEGSDKPFEFRKHWNAARTASKVPNFRFHDLRHTAASYLALDGHSLAEIGEVLGQRDPRSTKRYTHFNVAHKQKVVASLADKI